MASTFEDFLSALLAFESGWDRERYDAGIIADWQLDTWAGGTVETFFPTYSSWSDLTDAEWETMAYRSMNTLGFVGYQFGEALLIDLGYYDDDFYYGNGAGSNTWDGTWTGKNGVNSLEDFMTKSAQDVTIREAFGHNLSIIENGLSAAGRSLDEFLGTTVTYTVGGADVPITLTLTGLLAAAHLRGAPAATELLLNGSLSFDEFGTSILQYLEQFGGYEAPDTAELIAYFEDRLTGDEGLGSPGDPATGGGAANGTANVDANSADVAITWAWGSNTVVTDFDPATDTVFVDWFKAGEIDVFESDGSVVFSVPSNNQTTTLQGVSLAALTAANFTILDDTAAAEILASVGSANDQDGSNGSGDGDTGDTDNGSGGSGGGQDGGIDPGTGDGAGDPSGNGTANVTEATATVAINWAWGTDEVVTDFDPSADTIFVGWFRSEHIDVYESGGNVVFAVPSNNQATTLQGVSLSDLSQENFTILDDSAAAEILSAVSAVGNSDPGNGGADASGENDPPSGGNDGDNVQDVVNMTWNWGAVEVVSGFAPSEDVLDFGSLSASGVGLSEAGADLHIEVLGNGGHTYVIEDVRAEDLTLENLAAASWNDAVLDDPGGVIDQLQSLGNDHIG